MRSTRKRTVRTVALVAVTGLMACLLYYVYTQTHWVESAPYARINSRPARTLVVVYSRTGNTFGVAKETARYFDADLLRIEAPQYGRDIEGQLLASRHADQEVTTTPIEHAPVNLAQYELVVLCAPTWWFRPAPPLWSFVENHDFGGAKVFLLMTGNSRLTEERTGKFGPLVQQHNGQLLGRLFLRRGRIHWQASPDALHKTLREALQARERLWPIAPR